MPPETGLRGELSRTAWEPGPLVLQRDFFPPMWYSFSKSGWRGQVWTSAISGSLRLQRYRHLWG